MRTTHHAIVSHEQAAANAREVRASGGLVVFTNGVFDILHPGHTRYLRDARSLGDILIVGINSDRSVRAIKGPERPVNPAEERAEVLLALSSVDVVAVFDDDSPLELVKTVQPDILVKGADWGPDRIVGREIVEARGGRVVRIELRRGFSTTGLIEDTRRTSGQ